MGTGDDMKLLRSAAVIGVAKKLYDESKKPENQRRMQDAMAKVKAKRTKRPR